MGVHSYYAKYGVDSNWLPLLWIRDEKQLSLRQLSERVHKNEFTETTKNLARYRNKNNFVGLFIG